MIHGDYSDNTVLQEAGEEARAVGLNPWVLGSLASLPQVRHWGGLAGHHAGLHAREEVRPGVRAPQQHGRGGALWQQLRRLLLHQLLHALCLPGKLRLDQIVTGNERGGRDSMSLPSPQLMARAIPAEELPRRD